MAEVADGALAVLGNHDEAVVSDAPSRMNEMAAAAIAWTRERIGPEQRAFIRGLPLAIEEDGRLYVHAEASDPGRWRYVTDAEVARRSMEATQAHATFCGHVHKPALYSLGETGKLTGFGPIVGAPVPLGRGRSWLAVLGAVGQPRDGDPSAAYLMIETAPLQVTWLRVPYDVATAAEKIRAAGLPIGLAERLFVGR
jgi:diadenosine tetraphosphatase ApaH/serine/threonine PP2A family protein phosphatase